MVLGIDAFMSLIVVCGLIALTPTWFPVVVAKDVYGLSSSVLSIVFSVFTAALAIIISSPDDKFVRFLDAEGFYRDLLWGFTLTLGALFVALVFSIAAFSWTSYQLAAKTSHQHHVGVIACGGLLTYALGATLTSTLSAIRYARTRAAFLRSSV
jgi:hypothetical protein